MAAAPLKTPLLAPAAHCKPPERPVINEEQQAKYDWAVTKWIHLNNGDAGMLALFEHIHGLLNDGGHLVVEPQPMSNYQRASKKNKELRETYKTIKIQPPFGEELRAQGFESIAEFEREEEGFSRPVHIWRKLPSS